MYSMIATPVANRSSNINAGTADTSDNNSISRQKNIALISKENDAYGSTSNSHRHQVNADKELSISRRFSQLPTSYAPRTSNNKILSKSTNKGSKQRDSSTKSISPLPDNSGSRYMGKNENKISRSLRLNKNFKEHNDEYHFDSTVVKRSSVMNGMSSTSSDSRIHVALNELSTDSTLANPSQSSIPSMLEKPFCNITSSKDIETETDIVCSNYSCINSFPSLLNNHAISNNGSPLNFMTSNNKKENQDDRSSVVSLTSPENRWKAMSHLAGSHKQNQTILNLSHRIDMTPESLKFGVPPAVASKIVNLRCARHFFFSSFSEQEQQCPYYNNSYSYFYEHDYAMKANKFLLSFGQAFGSFEADLPAFLDVVEHLFPNLLHIAFESPKIKISNDVSKEKNEVRSNDSNSNALDNDQLHIKEDTESKDEIENKNIGEDKANAALRESYRMKRLYIILRLPDLQSINDVPITEDERRIANPLDPNGYKVKKSDWLTKAMKDWEDEMDYETHDKFSENLGVGNHGIDGKIKSSHENIESWESMSSGGIECALPYNLPSSSINKKDNNQQYHNHKGFPRIPETQEKGRDQDEKDTNPHNYSFHAPRESLKDGNDLDTSLKYSLSSFKHKKRTTSQNELDSPSREDGEDLTLKVENKDISRTSNSAAPLIQAMRRRKSFPFSAEESSSLQKQTLFLDVTSGRVQKKHSYTKKFQKSEQISLDAKYKNSVKDVIEDSLNHTSLSYSSKKKAKKEISKHRSNNRRPPQSPASAHRPEMLGTIAEKGASQTWNRRRWRKSKGGKSDPRWRHLITPSTSMADEFEEESSEEEDLSQ